MTISRRKFLQSTSAALAASSLTACGGHDKEPVDGVPRSSFDEDATAEEVTEGIDLKGKLAVVTGCTSGIGFETMRVLAMRGAWVVGTSRSLERAEKACKQVIGVTTPVALDLADPDSIVRCADSIRSINSPIDILVCNAGYRGGGNDLELVNGVEKHFAINHLGHFILVNRLLDRLYLSWQGRIVIVASRTSYTDAPVDGILFDDLNLSHEYDDATAYGQSKLANVLFALELGQLLKGTRITANALHPGVINTELDRNLKPITQFAFSLLTKISGKTIEQGAATSCFVATSKLLGSTSGRYFEDCNAVNVIGRNHLTDMPMADKLWFRSEELTSDYLVTPQVPDETSH
jgi:NAD(P)-dependent dehydrogenase (short-subunit alcohol dehydrogenase family)